MLFSKKWDSEKAEKADNGGEKNERGNITENHTSFGKRIRRS